MDLGEPASAASGSSERGGASRRCWEPPAGLGVMTIHAAARCCGGSPLEAGVAPHFESTSVCGELMQEAREKSAAPGPGWGHSPGPSHAGPGRDAGRAGPRRWPSCWASGCGCCAAGRRSATSCRLSPDSAPAGTTLMLDVRRGLLDAAWWVGQGCRAWRRDRRLARRRTWRSPAAALALSALLPQGRRRRAADAGDQEGGLRSGPAGCYMSKACGAAELATSCADCCWPRTDALLRVAFATIDVVSFRQTAWWHSTMTT